MIKIESEEGFDVITEKLGGTPVKFRIKQLTAEEYLAFDLDMVRYRRIGARYTPERRLPDELEQIPVMVEKDGKQAQKMDVEGKPEFEYKIPDNRVEIRRLNEMTDDERERYESMSAHDEVWSRGFIQRVFEKWVFPFPDQIPGVVSGRDLCVYFRGNKTALKTVLFDVSLMNNLTPELKKALQSALDSATGSGASSPRPNGDAPATTAVNAESADSAESVAATA